MATNTTKACKRREEDFIKCFLMLDKKLAAADNSTH